MVSIAAHSPWLAWVALRDKQCTWAQLLEWYRAVRDTDFVSKNIPESGILVNVDASKNTLTIEVMPEAAPITRQR